MCTGCVSSATQVVQGAASGGGVTAAPALLAMTALVGIRLLWSYQVERIRRSRFLQALLLLLALSLPVALLFWSGIL